MKPIVYLFLLNLPLLLNAQSEFAPLGAKWHYSIVDGVFGAEATTLEVIEVKAINGKQMKRLASVGEKGCAGFSEWLYEEGGKVYQYFNQKSYLLYDFKAKKGDTWKIIFQTLSTRLDSVKIKVDSVASIKTVFGIKQVQYISQVYGWKGEVTSTQIIEDIGFNRYFFPNFGLCDLVPYEIRCYTEGNQTEKFVKIPCDFHVKYMTANDVELNDFKISPNPTTGNITITSKELFNLNTIWTLYDNFGYQVGSQMIDNESINIDLPSHLPTGIYYWRIIGGIKMLEQGKLVILE